MKDGRDGIFLIEINIRCNMLILSACNSGDLGSIPGSKGSPGEGNGNPGTWWATVHGVTKSWIRLSD